MCHVARREQRELLAAMKTLRSDVVSGVRSPTDFLVFHNGPEQRRTLFVGVIAVSPEKHEREEQLRAAAQRALQDASTEFAVVMSWTPVEIELPYFGIMLAARS